VGGSGNAVLRYSPGISLRSTAVIILYEISNHLTDINGICYRCYATGQHSTDAVLNLMSVWPCIIDTIIETTNWMQFDVCVTVHHWYNNRNSQLDATITNFNCSVFSLFTFFFSLPHLLRQPRVTPSILSPWVILYVNWLREQFQTQLLCPSVCMYQLQSNKPSTKKKNGRPNLNSACMTSLFASPFPRALAVSFPNQFFVALWWLMFL